MPAGVASHPCRSELQSLQRQGFRDFKITGPVLVMNGQRTQRFADHPVRRVSQDQQLLPAGSGPFEASSPPCRHGQSPQRLGADRL